MWLTTGELQTGGPPGNKCPYIHDSFSKKFFDRFGRRSSRSKRSHLDRFGRLGRRRSEAIRGSSDSASPFRPLVSHYLVRNIQAQHSILNPSMIAYVALSKVHT
jgi:hypothetical protein